MHISQEVTHTRKINYNLVKIPLYSDKDLFLVGSNDDISVKNTNKDGEQYAFIPVDMLDKRWINVLSW
jgi:hypothetical protein